MISLLIVEGNTDEAFFKGLLERLYPDSLHVPVENTQGKDAIPNTVRAHLRFGVSELAVAQDIDDGPPSRVLQSVQTAAYSAFDLTPPGGPPMDSVITVEGRTVYVLAMGMYQDPELNDLGISKHALEDYLLKLVLEDPALQVNVRELRVLLDSILPSVRDHDGRFDSTKDLFQLIKPLVQLGFNDTGVVQKMIEDADENILRSVLAPLLHDLDRALGH